MKTKAELLAAAEALEWAASKVPVQFKIYEIPDRAAELRAQASKAPEQEPVVIPIGYVFRSKRDGSIGNEIAPVGWATFESQMEKLRQHPWLKIGQGEIIPLYTHPAPAPASLRNMTEADFDKAHGIEPAVGVPDIAGLIKELNRYAVGFGMPTCKQASEALTALQSQNKQQAERIKEMRELLEAVRACGVKYVELQQDIEIYLERTK